MRGGRVFIVWKKVYRIQNAILRELSMNTLPMGMECSGAAALRRAEALLGVMFTTPKELRHQAEQLLDRLFVPTEVRSTAETTADVVLRPEGLGEIHVHAHRERHWQPFQVTHVDTVP